MSVNHLQKMMLSMIHNTRIVRGDQAKQWVSGGLAKNDGDAKDDIVNVKLKSVAVGKLVPIQEQIYFDKSIRNVSEFNVKGTKDFAKSKNNFYIVSKDNRIIDGRPQIFICCIS